MKKLILVLSIFFLVVSCATKKKIIKEEKHLENVSVFLGNESSLEKKITPVINDDFFVSFTVNNKEIDSIIDLKFKHFKSTKKSGKSSYKVFYDTIKKGIQITTNIEASESVNSKKAKVFISERTTEKENKIIKKERKPPTFRNFFIFLFFIGFLFLIIKYRDFFKSFF